MRLSVIIVNYNVKHFLEQCLASATRACTDEIELIVVDNKSVDGSNEMIREKFPHVKLIANKKNVGFSVANNQGIKESSAEYVLLLNPDTVVKEDTFTTCLEFMDKNQNAGALGVHMIDGKGEFLPESKRGLPTPTVAFYKIFGLAALFPKSKKFGAYHLTYLPKNENHEVDILSGAFMFIRKKALNEVGLLDETFFMYGEDIDLSYRIVKGGYKNHYLADTQIIHYKGESTKKGSLNYVFVFYRAMIIFAKKHFSSQGFQLFSIIINLAIYFRAGLAISHRLWKQLAIPLLDCTIYFSAFTFSKMIYQNYSGISYDNSLTTSSFAIFSGLIALSSLLNGGYDQPLKYDRLVKGTLIGIIAMFVTYAILPESWRFSRAILLIGSSFILCITPLWRFIANKLNNNLLPTKDDLTHNLAIVGTANEFDRISSIIPNHEDAVAIRVSNEKENNPHVFVPSLDILREVTETFDIKEVIFSASSLKNEQIIQFMLNNQTPIHYKIAPENSDFVVGSNSINTSGDFYENIKTNAISLPANKRKKRILDFTIGLLLLFTSPIASIKNRSTKSFSNAFNLLSGNKTTVGYLSSDLTILLPKIKPAIVDFNLNPLDKNQTQQQINKLNIQYCKHYHIKKDIYVSLRKWSALHS